MRYTNSELNTVVYINGTDGKRRGNRIKVNTKKKNIREQDGKKDKTTQTERLMEVLLYMCWSLSPNR